MASNQLATSIKEVKEYLNSLKLRKIKEDPKKYYEKWLKKFPSLKIRSIIKFQRMVETYAKIGELIEVKKCKGCGNAFVGVTYCSRKCCTSDPKRAVSISKSLKERTPEEKEKSLLKYRKTNKEKYGYEHPMQSPEIKACKEITNIVRYGHPSPLHSEVLKEKIEQTMLKKYGRKHNWNTGSSSREKGKKTLYKKYGVYEPMDSPEIKEKIRKTNKEKYGNEYYFRSEEGIKKIKGVFLEKYGKTNPMQIQDIRKRAEITNIERYGFANPLSSPKIQARITQTNIKKYGAPHFLQSPEGRKQLSKSLRSGKVREKIHNTKIINNSFNTSFPEQVILYWLKLFYKNVKTQYMSNDYPFNCDFYIPEINTYIEYQGVWVHGGEPYNKNNPEHKDKLKKWKNKPGKFYKYAIKVWTKTDSEKRRIAKKNNLNWLEFFNIEDFIDWILEPVIIKEKRARRKYQDKLNTFLDKINSDIDVKIANPLINPVLNIRKKTYIFEHEWKDKRTRLIWKSILKYKSGKSKSIFARKCSLREVDSKDAKIFLRDNHLQGECNGKIRLGLYDDDNLVALIVFGKPRFNRKYDWELLRFCNKKGYHVVGGASKLLKAFRKENPGSIISYSNKRLGEGEMYKNLGFELANQSPPNYWYFHIFDKIPMNRLQFQKHKLENKLTLFNKHLSEVENMRANGYLRFFDQGNLTYVIE